MSASTSSREANGLWELTGVIMEMRPDKLSYLVEIEGRVYTCISGRSKIKPVSKFKEGVLDLDLEEVGVSVSLDNSNPQVQVQPSLQRSICLIEKELCKSAPSCSLVSGSQHVPFSYLLPCPALASPAKEKLIRKN